MPTNPRFTFDSGRDRRFRFATSAVVGLAMVTALTGEAFAGNGALPGIIGGLVGGMVGSAVQQQQLYQQQQQQLQQQQYYYQQEQQLRQQQLYNQQLQQERYQQEQQVLRERRLREYRRRKAAEAAARAARARKAREEARARAPATPIGPAASGTIRITLQKDPDGTLRVPVKVNDSVTIPFIVDSGAATVAIPFDVFKTLLRSGTIGTKDVIKKIINVMANGSREQEIEFRLERVQVGDYVLHDVIASTMPESGMPLLGQSFLSRFTSWTQDNKAGTLVLTVGGGGPSGIKTASAQAPMKTSGAPSAASTRDATHRAEHGTTPEQAPIKAADPAPQGQAGAPAPSEPAEASGAPKMANSSEMHKSTAALTNAIVPSGGKHAATTPSFPKDTSYAGARRLLMALGYEPAPVPGATKCDPRDKTCFPERESCTSPGQCGYLWRREDTLILVRTSDNPPIVSSVECQVNCQ